MEPLPSWDLGVPNPKVSLRQCQVNLTQRTWLGHYVKWWFWLRSTCIATASFETARRLCPEAVSVCRGIVSARPTLGAISELCDAQHANGPRLSDGSRTPGQRHAGCYACVKVLGPRAQPRVR